jgi:adenine/guanine phosphoribosyltransferase-like PRPP-binding protein
MTINFQLHEAPIFSSLSYRNNADTCIFVGHDLLFSARLHAILKRHLPIAPFDADDCNYSSSQEAFRIDKLLSLVRYRNADTLILASELFLFCDVNFVVRLGKSLCDFSQEHYPLKIVFCKIDYPSPSINHFFDESFIHSIRSSYDTLKTLNSTFLHFLSDLKHLVLSFSSYIPSSFNNIQQNYLLSATHISRSLKVLNSCLPDDVAFYSCDDLAKLLTDYFYSEGALSVRSSQSASSLASLSSAVINQSEIRATLSSHSSEPRTPSKSSFADLTASPIFPSFPQSYCSLDVVYRNKPASTSHFSDTIVASTRLRLGAELANSIPIDVKGCLDFISPVPETGKYYAQGLANALGLPYIESLIKAKDIGRSFDIQNPNARRDFIQNKLALLPDLLDGKNVGFVDEAIFTGSTLRIVSELLAKTKINAVYFFIPTPECIQRCPFNMQPDRSMLSEYTRSDALPSYFDIDGVFFQAKSAFEAIIHNDHGSLCSFCFSSI